MVLICYDPTRKAEAVTAVALPSYAEYRNKIQGKAVDNCHVPLVIAY